MGDGITSATNRSSTATAGNIDLSSKFRHQVVPFSVTPDGAAHSFSKIICVICTFPREFPFTPSMLNPTQTREFHTLQQPLMSRRYLPTFSHQLPLGGHYQSDTTTLDHTSLQLIPIHHVLNHW